MSRQRLTIWYRRWEKEGAFGLEDHSSRPLRSPNVTPDELVTKIEELRRDRKWGPDRISGYLTLHGDPISQGAVYKVLVRLGLNHRRAIDRVTGEDKIAVQRYEKGHPGDMVHIDVKKVGKIPDGGGWRVHGRDSEQALKSHRKANRRPGYTYIHACVDDNSRIAYAECQNDERAVTAIAFFERARIFLATHGIEVKAVLTDNGSALLIPPTIPGYLPGRYPFVTRKSMAFSRACPPATAHQQTRSYRHAHPTIPTACPIANMAPLTQ